MNFKKQLILCNILFLFSQFLHSSSTKSVQIIGNNFKIIAEQNFPNALGKALKEKKVYYTRQNIWAEKLKQNFIQDLRYREFLEKDFYPQIRAMNGVSLDKKTLEQYKALIARHYQAPIIVCKHPHPQVQGYGVFAYKDIPKGAFIHAVSSR